MYGEDENSQSLQQVGDENEFQQDAPVEDQSNDQQVDDDEEAGEGQQEARDQVQALTGSLLPLVNANGLGSLHDDIQSLLKDVAFKRIEEELRPEKEAAEQENSEVLEDNSNKQALIENMCETSEQLHLNEDQLAKLLKERRAEMAKNLKNSEDRLERNANEEKTKKELVEQDLADSLERILQGNFGGVKSASKAKKANEPRGRSKSAAKQSPTKRAKTGKFEAPEAAAVDTVSEQNDAPEAEDVVEAEAPAAEEEAPVLATKGKTTRGSKKRSSKASPKRRSKSSPKKSTKKRLS